jgi:CheY-like chemotaxis protein
MKSVLLVEDDANTMEILASMLARKFPEQAFVCATNGRAGLELFMVHRPDVVITDLNMPHMDGAEMAGRIRTIKPDTKIIVITADNGKSAQQDAMGQAVKIDYYVYKPINFGDLFAAIDVCLGLKGKLSN